MEIIGHKQKIENLEEMIRATPSGKSYLFSGPDAIGKFQVAQELAVRLAKSQVSRQEEGDFLNNIFIVEPAITIKDEKIKQKKVSLDDIRQGLQFVSRAPGKDCYRIFILRDAHLLSESAQNMILKALEEPSERIIFILTTHEPEALLATVRSRVMEEAFQKVPSVEMEEKYTDTWLQENDIPPFFRAFGRPGVMESASQNKEEFQNKKRLLSQLYTITRLSVKERLDLAENLAANVPEAVQLLEWWLTGLQEQARREQKLEKKSNLYPFLEGILEVISVLKHTQGNARLQLEQLFFQIR